MKCVVLDVKTSHPPDKFSKKIPAQARLNTYLLPKNISNMSNILIIGATRGLGEALTKLYASDLSTTVHATTRSNEAPASPSGPNIKWITDIDLNSAETGAVLGTKAKGTHFDAVIITAGFFGKESFDKPDWKAEVTMYTTSSIAPVFLVHHLVKVGCVGEGSKVLLVSSESGSITLRHVSEGGGNYAHHASKAALNMVGKLLSLDLKEKGVAVGMVHPGFMRTEMTKNVGFDQFWDDGGGEYTSNPTPKQ